MEAFYIFVIAVLILLAVSDLIVGVCNDAVNFLNSAIGSKAASFKVVMILAVLGVLVGASFSSGMMEVARKGIFNPQFFTFSQIMIIFLAVMLTDVILLDLFNTFGLPTSTTVSIVFELLGASVGMATVLVMNDAQIQSAGGELTRATVASYINSSNALLIISGILLSIFFAFMAGAIIQFITRLMFSFKYERNLKYFSGIWGGIAITAIIYFMLVKGVKGATFMTDAAVDFINTNRNVIILASLVGWSVVLQFLQWIFRINVLRFIVLVGTFALAMAFAGNDLVNFIGVPLAGLESYKAFAAHPGTDPDSVMMVALTGPIPTKTLYLLIAGTIMVLALWTSMKARSVVKTSIDLSRQNEGTERFESSYLARSLVRMTASSGNLMQKILPHAFNRLMARQFNSEESLKRIEKDKLSFDLLRASVNLVVASILIAIGTSNKLPLSTTYVTFMVAMGTSLSDGAWGLDSAVNRITGVLTVIGGWFMTALSAFTGAFLVALFINRAGLTGIIIMLLIAGFFVIRTQYIFKRRQSESEKIEAEGAKSSYNRVEILKETSEEITSNLIQISKYFLLSIDHLTNYKRKKMKQVIVEVRKLKKISQRHKSNVVSMIQKLEEADLESGPYYIQLMDQLYETIDCLSYITEPAFAHLDNRHPALTSMQCDDLDTLKENVTDYFNFLLNIFKNDKLEKISEADNTQDKLIELIQDFRKNQIKAIKKSKASTKNSLIFLEILNETKNLLQHVEKLMLAYRDFKEN